MPLDDLRTLRNAPGLTTFQQGFLDDFADLVRSLAVAQLDPGQITGTVGGLSAATEVVVAAAS